MKRNSFRSLLYLPLVLFISVQCQDDEEVDPSVQTVSAQATSASTIMAKGLIAEVGNIPVVDFGFKYGTGYIYEQTISLGKNAVKGPFEKEISIPVGTGGNQISVRAYLENEKGIVLGEIHQVTLPQLTVSSVVPLSAKPGDQITITGTSFSTNIADNVVYFNETLATVTEATKTKLVVTVPPNVNNTSYYYGIRIVVRVGGQQLTATENFKVLPTVTDFNPKSGPLGTLITVTGSNLSGNSVSALVDDINVSPSVNSNTSMSFYIPVNATKETLPISISIGTSTIPMGNFQVTAPVVTDFFPKAGVSGTVITITGTNFKSSDYYYGANPISVKIGTLQCDISEVSPTQIKVVVPRATPLGSYNLTVSTAIHTVVAAEEFTLGSPKITDITPTSALQGTYITITGENFGNNNYYYESTVLLGTNQLQIYSWSETSIRAYIPTYTSTGTYKVTVNAGGQSVTSSQSVTVTN